MPLTIPPAMPPASVAAVLTVTEPMLALTELEFVVVLFVAELALRRRKLRKLRFLEFGLCRICHECRRGPRHTTRPNHASRHSAMQNQPPLSVFRIARIEAGLLHKGVS